MDVEKALMQLKDEGTGDKVLQVLHTASYFASEDIDSGIFLDLFDDSEELEAAIELLKRHSLFQSNEKANSIHMDKNVQERVQKLLKEQEKEEAVLATAIGLLGKAPVSHAMSVFNVAKGYPKLIKEHTSLPVEVMQGLLEVDRDLEASNFGREALNVLTESVGKFHPATIAVQRSLGLALVCVRKPNEALEELFEVYNKLAEIKGEKEVSQTLKLITKIVSTLTPDPETRVRQLVFGDVPVSETNNNSILDLWCEYALMLKEFKWIDEALPILVQVLEKRRELLHPDDDDICDVEDSIAHVYLSQKEFQKALEYFQKAYEKRKLNLGENCVKTVIARRGIADAYESLDMLDKAITEYEAIAEKFGQIMGEDDTTYLVCLGKVAYILYRQKNHEKSLNLYTEIYDKYVEVKGEKDILTLNVKHNLGSVLLDQGKIEEALSIWREVLEGYFEVLGPGHPETTDLLQKIFVITQRSDSGYSERILNLINNK